MTEEIKKILKFIDKSNSNKICRISLYESNITIKLGNDLLLIMHVDLNNIKYLENEPEVDIVLKEIYVGNLSDSIVVKNMSFQLFTHKNNYLKLLDIINIYNNYFCKIPSIEIISDNNDFCPYYNLFYKISLDISKCTETNFFNNVLKLKNKYTSCNFAKKYYKEIDWYGWQDFAIKHKISLNDIRILTLNTKTRRLAYFKMILNLFNLSNYYPNNLFNKKIENKASQYKNELLEYVSSKGAIETTKTGNSSKPYLETLSSLLLIIAQNNRYQLSKYGKIFIIINNKINNISSNYFNLPIQEKIFFLFFILQYDNLYLWSLLDIIYIQNNKTTMNSIKKVFQDYIIKQLFFVLKHSNISAKNKSKISLIIKRIQLWNKPEVYLEHIVEPRINWLLDLGLLEKEGFEQNNIILSKEGLLLFSALNSYFDIFQEKYTSVNKFIYMDFFNSINDIYLIKAKSVKENDIKLVDKYIDESFYLFKTIAPNRVTASQAIIYTCFMMIFKEKKIIDFNNIKSYLNSKKNTKYIFDWFKTENDGIIRQKRKEL